MAVMRMLVFLCVLAAFPALADSPERQCSEGRWTHQTCIRPAYAAFDICQGLRDQARAHALEPGFFARLIWQESRFDPNAVSPAEARGIAQFIDSTARLRSLKDQFNPSESLEKSAQYLAELTQELGNPGLAAVAYNAGEARAASFLTQGRGLPNETINYVEIITGLPAETWRDAPPKRPDFRLSKTERFLPACLTLARNRKISSLAPPKPPKPRIAPWGVQVGFGKSAAAAEASVTRLTRACSGLVAGEKLDMIAVKNRASGRPGYVFARIGRPDRQKAIGLCRQLRDRGCTCFVKKN